MTSPALEKFTVTSADSVNVLAASPCASIDDINSANLGMDSVASPTEPRTVFMPSHIFLIGFLLKDKFFSKPLCALIYPDDLPPKARYLCHISPFVAISLMLLNIFFVVLSIPYSD